MTRARIVDVIAPAVTLVASVAMYLIWRDGLRLHAAFGPIARALRPIGIAHPVPSWVRFSLPDALWQYAFCAIVLAVWRGQPWTARKIAWTAVPLLVGVASELGQLAHVVPGTYDPIDLALSCVAAVAALAVHGGFESRAFSYSSHA